ncbi:hypothetical protein SIN8267_00057 [Sinobacterium norvegicum]|uniref:Uncharacterized protein n=1 Tax=Sinobacterium norvegicum TaxID=1641715 RepID=A0ABM9AAF4_9GAMM|nr:DUF6586 family protein [Sinobacterium norvegicum]CAH0989980.1 hypothetical protein SIN8267_00057 [Sinobacterium norvegicum]
MRDYQRRIASLLQYCQQQLTLAKKLNEAERRGLMEAAVTHLYTAYRSYVVEVVSSYHVTEDSLPTSWQLPEVVELLQQGQHQSGELNELLTLSRQGWLCQLLTLHSRTLQLEQTMPITRKNAGQFAIAAVNLDAPVIDFDMATIVSIKTGFTELIQRQRQHSVES